MVNHLVLHYFPVVLALFLFELVRLVLAEFPLLLVLNLDSISNTIIFWFAFASPRWCIVNIRFSDKNTLVPFKGSIEISFQT
jgi:hypothetical protein